MKKLLLLLLALAAGIAWLWLGRQRAISPARSPVPTSSIPIVRKITADSPTSKRVHPVLPATHSHFTTLTH